METGNVPLNIEHGELSLVEIKGTASANYLKLHDEESRRVRQHWLWSKLNGFFGKLCQTDEHSRSQHLAGAWLC